MIDDLHLLGEIVVDLKAKLCYSKSKPCEHEMTILQGFRLPKPLCNFSPGKFAIPGKILEILIHLVLMIDCKKFKQLETPVIFLLSDFSLSRWMTDVGKIGDKATLEQWAIELLKSELKLSNYMLEPMCKRSQYLTGNGNWNSSGMKSEYVVLNIVFA